MGCIWLADVKMDLKTRFLFMPVGWGGRQAIVHCCCDWPKVDAEELRKIWNSKREAFRKDWAKELGSWPMKPGGEAYWPAHHIHDLLHGGAPADRDNILPAPQNVHDEYSRQYPLCYAGEGKWNLPGPEHPYGD